MRKKNKARNKLDYQSKLSLQKVAPYTTVNGINSFLIAVTPRIIIYVTNRFKTESDISDIANSRFLYKSPAFRPPGKVIFTS